MLDLGYIYVRDHSAYNGFVKVGKTQNIPEREQTYNTGEYIRGRFIHIWEIGLSALSLVDRLIKYKFRSLNRYKDAGTEFYDREIIRHIPELFKTTTLKWRELSAAEIENLARPNRMRPKWKKAAECINIMCKKERASAAAYIPRPYQVDIINETVELLKTKNMALLNLACGVGKTLTSLWVYLHLFPSGGRIVVSVPNLILLAQWRQKLKDLGIEGVVTTYQSAHKLDITHADMLICDEVHHLGRYFGGPVDDVTGRQFGNIMNIKTKYVLGLSATPAVIDGENVYPTVSRSTLWAIENNIICDYIINCIYLPGEQANLGEELQYAAKAALWCLLNEEPPYKMLIYANSRASAERITELVNGYMAAAQGLAVNAQGLAAVNAQGLAVNAQGLAVNAQGLAAVNAQGLSLAATYDGAMSKIARAAAMAAFNGASKFALVCVYCLGEGWDFPDLDAVLFAENMTSEVRIVQAALRAGRKNINKPDKVAKIIIPLLGDFKHIGEVVRQIGAEDSNFTAKLRAYCPAPSAALSIGGQELFTFNEEITNLLRVHSITRLEYITCHEGNELTYSKAKQIINKYFNGRFKKPSEYVNTILKYGINLPTDPEIFFKDFIDWTDYLGVDMGEGRYKRGELFAEIRRSADAGIIDRFMSIETMIRTLAESSEKYPEPILWFKLYGISKRSEMKPAI